MQNHLLPESIQNYVQSIVSSRQASKLILFGSRARGEAHPGSDFDIAVEWIDPASHLVLQLKAELNEAPITLYRVDLLDLNTASPQYLDQIKKEGKVLWQKKD